MPSDDVTLVAAPKKVDPFPKCLLLSKLGVDYLHQFARVVDMKLDLDTTSMDPSKVSAMVSFLRSVVMEDAQTTECILLSIFFFLLELQHLGVPGAEQLSQVSQDIQARCSLPDNIA